MKLPAPSLRKESALFIDATANIEDGDAPQLSSMKILDRAQAKIALVADGGKLIGSVVDGDVRRALLQGHTLQTPVRKLMHGAPFVLPVNSSRQKILESMHMLEIKQIPLVGQDGAICGIAVHDLLLGLQHRERPNHVVIMAGGKGKRLMPMTQDTPKPMVLVGGKPILEWILLRLTHYGFRNFTFAVNYLGHKIEEYFGDGSSFGCAIAYSHEREFLGTAGALSLISPNQTHPLLVMNGDILTGINFGDLVDFHTMDGNSGTVCARAHRIEVPYGVIESKGGLLTGIVEKPIYENLVSAGIYVLSPGVLGLILPNTAVDMPDLIVSVVRTGQRVAIYSLEEEWVDVGRHEDLEHARRSLFNANN